MSQFLVLVVVLLLAGEATCFPGGAPMPACAGLAPATAAPQSGHGAIPQTDAVPYMLGNFVDAFGVEGAGGGRGSYVPGQTYQCKLAINN